MSKILIVDGNKHLRTLYTLALRQEGHDVMVAASGGAALEQIKSAPPDVLLVDTFGWDSDVARQVASLVMVMHIPVILHTAFVPPMEDVMRLVAEVLLVKSSDVSELMSKIRELASQPKAGLPGRR